MKSLFNLEYLVPDFSKKYQNWQFNHRFHPSHSSSIGGGGSSTVGKRTLGLGAPKEPGLKRSKADGTGNLSSTNPTLRPCVKTWSRCAGNTPISVCDATCNFRHDDVVTFPRSFAKSSIDKYFDKRTDKTPLVKLTPWIARIYDTVLTNSTKEALRLQNRDL
jgi:hypothetical protein